MPKAAVSIFYDHLYTEINDHSDKICIYHNGVSSACLFLTRTYWLFWMKLREENGSKKEDTMNEGKGYGSQYWLRLAVNNARFVIDREIALAVGGTDCDPNEWISPLEPDFIEYQDEKFLDKLRVKLPRIPLQDFWPKKGTCLGWPCTYSSRTSIFD